MPKWCWTFALGLALLVPGAWYWFWLVFCDPVRPSDERSAFERLAVVPLGQVQRDKRVEVTVVIPDNASWRRVIRNWGDPGYFIGTVSPGPKQYSYCLSDLGVHTRATSGGRPLVLEPVDAPYGYAINCKHAGVLFRAPPAARVKIEIEGDSRPEYPVDLVVEPHWTGVTKDHLVGLSILESLHVQTLATALVISGALALTAAAISFKRRQRQAVGTNKRNGSA